MLTVCRVSRCEYVSKIGKTCSMMPNKTDTKTHAQAHRPRKREVGISLQNQECKDWHKQTMKHAFII